MFGERKRYGQLLFSFRAFSSPSEGTRKHITHDARDGNRLPF